MQASFLSVVLLPLALAVIMMGLGLSLKIDDFKRVLVFPKAVLIGLL
jgi:BASS family bile acid:Na+ symporter